MSTARQGLPPFVHEALDESDTDWNDIARTIAAASEEWASAANPSPIPLVDKLLRTVTSPRLKYAPFFDALKQLWQLSEEQVEAVFETERWRLTPLLGVRVREVALPQSLANFRARVTNFQPGVRFPHHTHRALEQVLVLEGAYTDTESGVTYGPGDLHTMAPGTNHGLVIAQHGRCIAASMHQAPFEFKAWPLRVLARLTGN